MSCASLQGSLEWWCERPPSAAEVRVLQPPRELPWRRPDRVPRPRVPVCEVASAQVGRCRQASCLRLVETPEGVMTHPTEAPRVVPDPVMVAFDLRHLIPFALITACVALWDLMAPKKGYPTASYVVWDTSKHPVIGPLFVGVWSGLTWHLFVTDGRSSARHLVPVTERQLRAVK